MKAKADLGPRRASPRDEETTVTTDEPTKCCLCDDEAVAIYDMPRGCVARPGLTVQPLCAHHERKMTPIGGRVELLKDLRVAD
jgi:hypothetical protein